MSASMPGGGKRSANFELNLVPFIDLFSALICFLLMTAAWQNLEVVNTGAPPKAVDLRDDDQPLPIQPALPKVDLAVTLYFDRVDLSENNHVRSIPHLSGSIDTENLKSSLAIWHKRYPEKKDVLLSTENRSPYKHLITLMDRLIDAGFPEVGITLN
jgi:biopolymer transport protein ExbD